MTVWRPAIDEDGETFDLEDLTRDELWAMVCDARRERDEARRLLAEWLAGPMSDESYDAGLGKRTRAALAEFDGEAGEP